jgi:hypothetical protein
MEKEKEIDRQFDRFLTKMLAENIPGDVRESLQQSFKKFRPRLPEDSLKGRPLPFLWKYAVLAGLVLALITGIYLYDSDFKSKNKTPLQVVCLKTEDNQHCDLNENQGNCLARLLKECIQSKTYLLALETKIDSNAIDVQVAEETGAGRCGKPGAPDENRQALKVVVQIKDSMALAQKENLVQEAIKQCPICEESQKFACVSYQVLE